MYLDLDFFHSSTSLFFKAEGMTVIWRTDQLELHISLFAPSPSLHNSSLIFPKTNASTRKPWQVLIDWTIKLLSWPCVACSWAAYCTNGAKSTSHTHKIPFPSVRFCAAWTLMPRLAFIHRVKDIDVLLDGGIKLAGCSRLRLDELHRCGDKKPQD